VFTPWEVCSQENIVVERSTRFDDFTFIVARDIGLFSEHIRVEKQADFSEDDDP
jgi:hypothetical protein